MAYKSYRPEDFEAVVTKLVSLLFLTLRITTLHFIRFPELILYLTNYVRLLTIQYSSKTS
jgi:hypothetical protein